LSMSTTELRVMTASWSRMSKKSFMRESA
jgi:hypothetical protein